jgi:hypothetical protein
MERGFNRLVAAACWPILGLATLTFPASAQPVAFSELEGLAIEADIHRAQDVRRQGKTAAVRIHQNWKFSMGPEKAIALNVNTTAQTPKGRRTGEPNIGTFTLDEPRKVPSRGGGEAVWKFADGTLSFIRTFPSGAYRAHFAFVRAPSGFTCSVTEGFARENGKGEIRLESAVGGGEITILSTKQLPSTCKVSKKK